MLTTRTPIVVIFLFHCPFPTIAATLRYSNHLVEWWADILHDGDRMACRKVDAAAPDASDCLRAIEVFPDIPYPTGPFIASPHQTDQSRRGQTQFRSPSRLPFRHLRRSCLEARQNRTPDATSSHSLPRRRFSVPPVLATDEGRREGHGAPVREQAEHASHVHVYPLDQRVRVVGGWK